MNFKKEYVAAIDIGTTKIVAVLGKRNPNGKIEILGMTKTVSKGVKRGVVQNIDETVAAIQTVVNDVQQKTGAKISDVFVGIAGQHIKSVKNRGYINRDSYDDDGEVDGIGQDADVLGIHQNGLSMVPGGEFGEMLVELP